MDNILNNRNTLITVSTCVVAFGAIVCCRASNDEGQAEIAASSDSSRQTDSYTGCVKIFDGKSFKGWEADPSTWSIVDGAMRGVGGSSRLAYTTADYGSFRLIEIYLEVNPKDDRLHTVR